MRRHIDYVHTRSFRNETTFVAILVLGFLGFALGAAISPEFHAAIKVDPHRRFLGLFLVLAALVMLAQTIATTRNGFAYRGTTLTIAKSEHVVLYRIWAGIQYGFVGIIALFAIAVLRP